MNVKKAIGAGLLVALVGCDQIQPSAFALTQLPAGKSQIYLVNNYQKPQTFTPSNSGPNSNHQHGGVFSQIPPYIPPPQSVPPVKNPASVPSNPPQQQSPKSKPKDQNAPNQLIIHNHPGGQPYGQTIDNSNKGKSDDKRQNEAVKSESGHSHTPNNKAGDNPDDSGSKHSWKDKQGNPHETEQSKDKEGRVHQIHRWIDHQRRSHETEHWTDSNSNVHQCHRWEDG